MINNMKFITLIFIGSALHLNAQQAPVNAGGELTGTGGSASYSIGQVTTSYESSSTHTVNEGVQQPYEWFVVSVQEQPGISISLDVYPNPTADLLTISIEPFTDDYSFELVNELGQQLIIGKLLDAKTTLQLRDYPTATYFLRIKSLHGEPSIFKLIKQ
jgi:hypothetical protein